jgi:hypothetical protein
MGTTLLVALTDIRISDKQKRKVSDDKVRRHMVYLETGEDLYPIDVCAIGDGTFTIAGNGRHRYLAYLYSGYSHIPVIVQNLQPSTGPASVGFFIL